MEYQKDFDGWNREKKRVHNTTHPKDFFYHAREIWWCAIGVNIGVETDGKNNSYERPVLIVKKFNAEMFWGLPLTSKDKSGVFFIKISFEENTSTVALSQVKTMSSKRLLRKMGMLPADDFEKVLQALQDLIKKSNPLGKEGVLGGRSH